MYTNLAYLGKPHEDIVDYTKPFMVTCCGYYRVHTSSVISTERPNGRGDYQLLYIAEGKAHFYFDGKDGQTVFTFYRNSAAVFFGSGFDNRQA